MGEDFCSPVSLLSLKNLPLKLFLSPFVFSFGCPGWGMQGGERGLRWPWQQGENRNAAGASSGRQRRGLWKCAKGSQDDYK